MTDESKSLKRIAGWVLSIAVITISGIAGYKYHFYSEEKERREAEMNAGPQVHIATLKMGVGEHKVTLIGETRPYQSATLYAKVSGYLKKIVVDKGDLVNEGQFLAYIESPETDEAFLAAEADAKNKKAILERLRTLFGKNLISQQEFDQAKADSEVADAKLGAQRTLKGYETLRAPFKGTVTARYADPGALVQNATSSDTSTLPVVMVADVKRLRVDAFIDQRDAPYVKKDDLVVVTLPERPGFKLDGKVARVTNELDPRTKMLLTEIDIPNENNDLVAGSFVQVSLTIKSPAYIEAPVEALVLKDDKTFLTALKDDSTLTYKQIAVGPNDGKVIAVSSGATVGDKVILNIGTTLPEGSKVRPLAEPSPAPAGAKK